MHIIEQVYNSTMSLNITTILPRISTRSENLQEHEFKLVFVLQALKISWHWWIREVYYTRSDLNVSDRK